MEKSSNTGVDLQVGIELEVGVQQGPASVSGKIPPPFQRAWGKSSDLQKIKNTFRNKKGIVAISSAKCQKYQIKIVFGKFDKVPFTKTFKNAIKELDELNDAKPDKQIAGFRKFIKVYGTHFLLTTRFGAEVSHRTEFSSSVKKKFNKDKIKECEYVTGMKVFGLQVEENNSDCSSEDQQQLYESGDSKIETSEITKGSVPHDTLNDWAQQEFVAVPLTYQLAPIVNLFKENYLGKKVSVEKISKWFLPLYFDYCKSMYGSPCTEETGCGFDDKCPADTDCVVGSKDNYCTGKTSFWSVFW